MDFQRYIDRLSYMDDLIRKRRTGVPSEFAEKLNLSRSTLMEYLEILRQLGGPILYDRIRQTYYYSTPCRLVLGFQLNDMDTPYQGIIENEL